jgi:hypothetical protein
LDEKKYGFLGGGGAADLPVSFEIAISFSALIE